MTTAWIALLVMIVSEAAAVARVEPFWSWNTPIVWTAFILFADSIVFHARRSSWIRSNGREFCALSLLSVPLWLVFESYNQVIRNWYYVGLPLPARSDQSAAGWDVALRRLEDRQTRSSEECLTMYVFVRLLFDRLIAPGRPGSDPRAALEADCVVI